MKEEGWLSWLRAPAECAAARKEDPALQTSCFCCVPTGPKLSLTERGQIPPRRGKPWARVGPGRPAEPRPCQTSPWCEARTCTRPRSHKAQEHPGNILGTSRAFARLPPAAPGDIPSLCWASSSSTQEHPEPSLGFLQQRPAQPRGRGGSRKSCPRSVLSRPIAGHLPALQPPGHAVPARGTRQLLNS